MVKDTNNKDVYVNDKSVPLFTPEETVMVARDISSALMLLNKELVAHRDLKPENILIRLPAGVSRQQALLDNINHPGIAIALTDFGNHPCCWRHALTHLCQQNR
jgi:serine/threonine protein kinase